MDQDGNVTAVNSGTTSIVVDVVDSYGGEYRFYIPITICSPHFEKTVKCVAINEIVEIPVLDLPGNITGVNASNKNKILIDHYSQDKVYIKGMVKGTTTLTVWVGSYQISCKIIVTNPMLKKYYGFYQPKKSFKLYYKSASKYSDVTWSSSNNKIAVVDNKGLVKTKKYGGVLINCNVDGREIQFHLGVTTKKAVKVLRYGLTKVGHNKYSQARRMSKGYYDCSSYVYRCSRAVKVKLVRKTSWAPVAAEIGQYYYRRHKIVKTKSKEYSDKNLRPGDLILFGGKKAPKNGRFKRIYHIAFYIGNGETMESSSRFNNVSIIHRGYIKKKEVPVVVRPY